jgi:hypothetical protein
MGANLVYLPRPNKKKHSQEGRNVNCKYVLSAMQGWRLNMVSGRELKNSYRKMHTYAILTSTRREGRIFKRALV